MIRKLDKFQVMKLSPKLIAYYCRKPLYRAPDGHYFVVDEHSREFEIDRTWMELYWRLPHWSQDGHRHDEWLRIKGYVK